jgi:hypothetical protein
MKNTTNFNSFATNGKNRSIRKEQKGFFGPSKMGERFFRMQKNFFSNKNAMKNESHESSTKSDRKPKREELLKTFRSILNVPKTFRPFQKERSVANELKFVVR